MNYFIIDLTISLIIIKSDIIHGILKVNLDKPLDYNLNENVVSDILIYIRDNMNYEIDEIEFDEENYDTYKFSSFIEFNVGIDFIIKYPNLLYK